MGPDRLSHRCFPLLLAAALGLGLESLAPADTERDAHLATAAAGFDEAPEGRDLRLPPTNRPTVEAAFDRESYPSGAVARLVIWGCGRRTTLQVFRAATETGPIAQQDVMRGSPVTDPRPVGRLDPGDVLRVRIGPWPTGLYYARLVAAAGRVGYAPFVVRPRHLGEHVVAVVLPTMTWQGYNFHDDNGDGIPDTWYQPNNVAGTARLYRPYENRGVIPHYKHYDERFLAWVYAKHPDQVDFLADADLDSPATTGRRLAAAYELLIFPGHHEYVTRHELDVVTRFRDLGGNLMFLSANNFYYWTVKRGAVMRRTVRFRDVGRPEASLVGTEYFQNDFGQHQGPWIVKRSPAWEWLFARTRIRPGSRFAWGGIEADGVAPSSPPGTIVVAAVPNAVGTHRDAQMTYYETRRGAKVFAAGAFTLAAAAWWPDVSTVLENLWQRLADDGNRLRYGGVEPSRPR